MTALNLAEGPARRMSAEDRREQTLDAALHVVARVGPAGASTDVIARESGVAQPCVVRTFAGKQPLRGAVFGRVADRIVAAFEDAPREGDPAAFLEAACRRLVDDRDVLLVLAHGFTAGSGPGVGAVRGCLDAVHRVSRERLGDDDRTAASIAQEMLLNVLLTVDAWNHPETPDLLRPARTCAWAAASRAEGEQP